VRENNESSEFLEDEFADREFLGLTSDLAAYGRYLDAAPMEIMPVNVWEQIATTLSLESADRIVPDSPAALGSDPAFRELENYRKRRIGGKWVGGLVAASVTLFAVGIGVNVLNSDTTDPNSVVAGEETTSLSVAPPQIIQAGFVPPTVEIMESGNDYNSANLKENVTRLLGQIGITKPLDMFMTPIHVMGSKKMIKANGMTGSLKSLRNCLNEITQSESSQAIFVDRATFQGMDAGVIVIPMVMFKGMDTLTTSDDRLKFATNLESSGVDLGALDVWVVGPNCGTLALDVYSHVSHSLN
jgi:hypothetical protein